MEGDMAKGISRSVSAVMAVGLSTGFFTIAMTGQAFAAKTIRKAPEHVPGEIVVKFRDADPGVRTQSTVYGTLEHRLGANAVVSVRTFVTDTSMKTIRIANDQDMGAALATLAAEPSVQYAEPNYIYHTFDDGVPNDPDFNKLWSLQNTGQTDANGQVGTPGVDIGVVNLWKNGITGSDKVLVAVIDTGIDWTHPDLQANLYTNPGEAGALGTNGKDDDRNGFADDIHGWNFNAKSNHSQDDHAHGSHCSGTIGGVGNNGVGIAGINWKVSLLPVKFLDKDGGGNLQDAVDAVNYATLMKAQVMSNSWGGGGFSQALLDAINKAKSAGILSSPRPATTAATTTRPRPIPLLTRRIT